MYCINVKNGTCRGTKCDCNHDWLWVRSPLEEIKYLFKFIFSYLRSGVEAKVRRRVPLINMQYLQNSAENGERSVLELNSLCLPCCVHDIASSCFFNYI